MKRSPILVLFICLTMNFGIAQSDNLSQFYSSDFAPIELNNDASSRVETLYANYKLRYKGDKEIIDEKRFVYEYNYFLNQLNRSGSVFYGDEISEYLENLKNYIIDDSIEASRINVYLTDYSQFNAFTNDFGGVYVNIGAIAHLESEEELLFLLAHEIGHVLLRHSHKQEVHNETTNDNWQLNEADANFERHQFSRQQELQADSIAIQLLSKRINAHEMLRLLEKLERSDSPIYQGQLDFSLLTGGADLSLNYIDSKWSDMINDTVYFEIEETDSLSTHPSIDKRKAVLVKQLKTSDTIAYTPIRNYDEVKLLASFVLVNSYLEEREFLKTLDLTVKLREKNPKDRFLIENQIKALTSLTQEKYKLNEFGQILNSSGNSLNDSDFLRLKKFYLSCSPADFNAFSHVTIQKLKDGLGQSLAVDIAFEKNYQFLYKNNGEFFAQDSISGQWRYQDFVAANEDTVLGVTNEEKLSRKDKELRKLKEEFLKELKDLGFVFIKTSNTQELMRQIVVDEEIDDELNSFISRFEERLKVRQSSIAESEMRDVMTVPYYAAMRFHRGKFLKSSEFKNEIKTALIQSDNLYIDSKNNMNHELNYVKSFELESQINQISKSYPKYSQDFSNSTDKGYTVFDNYLHKVILQWMDDKSSGESLNYSVFDDKIHSFLGNEDINYLVYTICIVNKNRGRGKRYYVNYYEIYFDIKNDGIAYLAKIASKEKPNEFQLEQLIYLAVQNKR